MQRVAGAFLPMLNKALELNARARAGVRPPGAPSPAVVVDASVPAGADPRAIATGAAQALAAVAGAVRSDLPGTPQVHLDPESGRLVAVVVPELPQR